MSFLKTICHSLESLANRSCAPANLCVVDEATLTLPRENSNAEQSAQRAQHPLFKPYSEKYALWSKEP